MTANELADEWDDKDIHYNQCDEQAWSEKAQAMLRQQAEEIEWLKAITVPCQICGCDPTRYEMRELTDEEIMQVWENSEWGDGEQEDILLFARVLLKKASEK
jgi:hypothetical protein